MPLPKKINSYQAIAIETASPGKIVLMLYDGALRFMDTAKEGFTLENVIERNETINNNIIRAQDILVELQSSLDHSVGGDLPKKLHSLYDYMYRELNQANIQKEQAPIVEAQKHLKVIRDTWAEMLLNNESEPNQEAQERLTSLSQSA